MQPVWLSRGDTIIEVDKRYVGATCSTLVRELVYVSDSIYTCICEGERRRESYKTLDDFGACAQYRGTPKVHEYKHCWEDTRIHLVVW